MYQDHRVLFCKYLPKKYIKQIRCRFLFFFLKMYDLGVSNLELLIRTDLSYYPVARVNLAKMSLFSSFVTSMIPGVSIFCLIQLHCSKEFMNINSTPMWPQYAASSRFRISRNGNDFSLPPINVVDGNLKTRSISDSSIFSNKIKKYTHILSTLQWKQYRVV